MTEVKCDFCGYSFDPLDGRASCSGCPLSRFCHKVKCPNCGYELAVRSQKREQKRERRAAEGV